MSLFKSKEETYKRIPMGSVIKKLDECLELNDFDWAEKHLKYWLEEARTLNDNDGMLSVYNELIELYRKTLNEEGIKTANDAIELVREIGLDDTITMGTALINAAIVYKTFGQTEKALELYEKAKIIYEFYLKNDDDKLAGLYNNMAVTLIELKKYDDAKQLFEKALEVMKNTGQGEIEMAITYCNLADLHAADKGTEEGEKEINECLTKAEELLNNEDIERDDYYAFVCEKCAPVFSYYGFFFTANELTKRAKEINGKV